MRSAFLSSLTLAALLGPANQALAQVKEAKLTSHYLATPPTIDGQPTEWQDSLTYDANSRLQYDVLNDQRTLYVRVRVADMQTQAKLAYLGMVVWLDSTGRNQQQLGIRYPLATDLEALQKNNNLAERPVGALGPTAAERQALHQERLRGVIMQAQNMELLRFRGSKEPVLTDSQAPLGVKAALGLDLRNNLIYELAVPLRLIYRKVPNLAAGQPVVAGVWLVGQKPKLPPGQSQPSDMSVVGPGGNSMMGGMGGMGGMGRGMRGGMRPPQPGFETFTLRSSARLVAN